MRNLTLALILYTGIALFPGILFSADSGTALKLHPTETAQPEKAVGPLAPAASINGYCCVNGEIISSTAEDCQNKNSHYYPTQQAALQGCRSKSSLQQKPTVKEMKQTSKMPAIHQTTPETLKPMPVKVLPVTGSGEGSAPLTLLPGIDLQTTAWKWSENPKEGADIGASAILNISVTNKGTEPAAESRITFRMLSGPSLVPGNPFDVEYDCPELSPGESHNFAWPQYSTQTWLAGTYQFEYTIDAQNNVTETNEQNNQRIFSVSPDRRPIDLSLFRQGEPAVMEDRTTHPNTHVNFSFIVYNLSPKTNSGPISLTFTCEGQPPGVGNWGGLGGGGDGGTGGCTPEGHGCTSFSFTREWPDAGIKNCEVTVRMSITPEREADPDNNHANFQVHVQPD